MATKKQRLANRATQQLNFTLGQTQEVTATVALNHYTGPALPARGRLEIELTAHDGRKSVAAPVDRAALEALGHWLVQQSTTEGGAHQ